MEGAGGGGFMGVQAGEEEVATGRAKGSLGWAGLLTPPGGATKKLKGSPDRGGTPPPKPLDPAAAARPAKRSGPVEAPRLRVPDEPVVSGLGRTGPGPVVLWVDGWPMLAKDAAGLQVVPDVVVPPVDPLIGGPRTGGGDVVDPASCDVWRPLA